MMLNRREKEACAETARMEPSPWQQGVKDGQSTGREKSLLERIF